MRDELETLEKELKRKAPKANPAVRKQTLSKAMETFDRHHQGLSLQPRQTGQEVNVMSWLKNRIHPLQPRYLVAACALCLVLAMGAASYWVLTWSTEPTDPSKTAGLSYEPWPDPAAGETLKPPEEAVPAEAAGDPPAGQSAPAPPERPAGRSAKVAAQAPAAAAEPAPVAATEGVTVDVTGEVSVLASEAPTVTYADPNQPLSPASPAPPPPPPPPPPGSVAGVTGGIMRGAGGGPPTSASTKGRILGLRSLTAVDPSRMRIAAEETGAFKERGNQAGDRFARVDPNRLKVVAEEPVSTFSIDVDTASYSFLRASLQRGVLPPKEAIRIEELINYFAYDYPAPSGRDHSLCNPGDGVARSLERLHPPDAYRHSRI